MYKKIVNPLTNRQVDVKSKLGKSIIDKYYKVLIGGGPNKSNCSSRKKKECKDECIWTNQGMKNKKNRCISKDKLLTLSKKVEPKTSKKVVPKTSKKVEPKTSKKVEPKTSKKVEPKNLEKKEKTIKVKELSPKIHNTRYLSTLIGEFTNDTDEGVKFINLKNEDISEPLDTLHNQGFYHWNGKFLPFELISQIVPEDMELQYGEESKFKGVDINDPAWGDDGLSSFDTESILATDSANWYRDSLSMNVGDIVIDSSPLIQQEVGKVPYLVVEHNGKKGLLTFIFGYEENDWDENTDELKPINQRFDNSFINDLHQGIHPITTQLYLLK